jgi:hypothetical protein
MSSRPKRPISIAIRQAVTRINRISGNRVDVVEPEASKRIVPGDRRPLSGPLTFESLPDFTAPAIAASEIERLGSRLVMVLCGYPTNLSRHFKN